MRRIGGARMRVRRWIPACAGMTPAAVIPAQAGIHASQMQRALGH